jgi:hypothetical protein
VLWAEEEQADEDKKPREEVEAEKQKDKKRGQQDDKAEPQKSASSVSLRQGVANLWPESQPPTLCSKR